MRVKCLFCGGWSDYQGLRDVSTEHAPDCRDRQQAVRARIMKETNGRTDIFATSTTMNLTGWQTSKPERTV